MSKIMLVPATIEFAADLYQFELNHRAYFEARINARTDSYYSLDAVAKALKIAESEAKTDVGYQFLICDPSHQIVGRINLTQVRRAHFHRAELGYRIGQFDSGKGYASEAIRQVCHKAFIELDLQRLEAAVSVHNLASIRALQRNGFSQYGHSKRSFELNGVWYDVLHFETHRSPLIEPL